VPGIKNPFSAIAIISEIGVDMSVFLTAKHLVHGRGLRHRIMRVRVKDILSVFPVPAFILNHFWFNVPMPWLEVKSTLKIRGRYLSIKKRRGHKRAIIAIARMLLTAIYHILSKDEPYNPELYKKIEILPKTRNITVDQAVSFARRHGYSVA
jgi:hypothetical protein